MDVLANQVTAGSGLDDTMIRYRIWHVGKHLTFIWTLLASFVRDGHMQRRLTEQPLDMVVKIKLCVWFHDHPSHDEAIFVPRSHGFHEPGGTQ